MDKNFENLKSLILDSLKETIDHLGDYIKLIEGCNGYEELEDVLPMIDVDIDIHTEQVNKEIDELEYE